MSLITPAQVRDLLPALGGTSEDALLQTLIDEAEEWVAAFVGLPAYSGGYGALSIEVQTYSLTLGEVDKDPETGDLALPVVALQSVSAVTVDTVSVDSGDYTVNTDHASLTHDLYTWAGDRISVTCSAGWAAGTLPRPVYQSILRIVKHSYDNRKTQGATSKSMGGAAVTLLKMVVPTGVEERLQPFRVAASVVA